MLYSILFQKKKENIINKLFYAFLTEWNTCQSKATCLRIAPLINANPRTVSARPTCVFITIGQDKCFKVFENRFCKGIGSSRLSEMLNEILGTELFKNLVQIISDVSGQHSNEIRK